MILLFWIGAGLTAAYAAPAPNISALLAVDKTDTARLKRLVQNATSPKRQPGFVIKYRDMIAPINNIAATTTLMKPTALAILDSGPYRTPSQGCLDGSLFFCDSVSFF